MWYPIIEFILFSENERVEYEEPADKRRRSDLVKNHAHTEVKQEPIDNGYGSQSSQRIISNEDRSLKENLLSKKEKELQEQRKQLVEWEKNGKEWNKQATEWYISNNIENVTEDNVDGWKEKQSYLKYKNTLEKKTAKYKKTIGDLEFQIDKLKTSLSLWRNLILDFKISFKTFTLKVNDHSSKISLHNFNFSYDIFLEWIISVME